MADEEKPAPQLLPPLQELHAPRPINIPDIPRYLQGPEKRVLLEIQELSRQILPPEEVAPAIGRLINNLNTALAALAQERHERLIVQRALMKAHATPRPAQNLN